MARFIVIHSPTDQATQEQVVENTRRLVASLPPETQWLNSWMVPDTWQLFCEWEAPDADAVRAVLEPFGELNPVEAIYEVQWIDPEWYKQGPEPRPGSEQTGRSLCHRKPNGAARPERHRQARGVQGGRIPPGSAQAGWWMVVSDQISTPGAKATMRAWAGPQPTSLPAPPHCTRPQAPCRAAGSGAVTRSSRTKERDHGHQVPIR